MKNRPAPVTLVFSLFSSCVTDFSLSACGAVGLIADPPYQLIYDFVFEVLMTNNPFSRRTFLSSATVGAPHFRSSDRNSCEVPVTQS